MKSTPTAKVFRKYTRRMTTITPSITADSTSYSLRTLSPTVKIHTPLTQCESKKNPTEQLCCQNCAELNRKLELSYRKNYQLTHELLEKNRAIRTLKDQLTSDELDFTMLKAPTPSTGTKQELRELKQRLSIENSALTNKVQTLEAAILSTTPQSIVSLCESLRSDFSLLECSYLSILAQNRALSASSQPLPALDALLFSN